MVIVVFVVMAAVVAVRAAAAVAAVLYRDIGSEFSRRFSACDECFVPRHGKVLLHTGSSIPKAVLDSRYSKITLTMSPHAIP